MIVGEDKVVVTSTLRGTHGGTYIGVPATGKRIEVPPIDIYRIADGKIAEHWFLLDFFTLLNQLGVIPSIEELAQVEDVVPR